MNHMHTDDIADIHGKNVIITGAAKGIGFGIASRFAHAGANCLLVDNDTDALSDASEKLATEGHPVQILRVDISSDEAADEIVTACSSLFGGVDVLINNAGIFPTRPTLEMTPAFFEHVLAVNLKALVFLSKAAGQQMAAQGNGGKIVNIASIDSLHPSMVGLAAYDASKGGVLMFSKNFALEMAAHGVQVNVIAPGAIATEGAQAPMGTMTAEQQQQMIEQFTRKVPAARFGLPDDIAKVAQFLSGTGSDYMTGSLVVVDGGMLLT